MVLISSRFLLNCVRSYKIYLTFSESVKPCSLRIAQVPRYPDCFSKWKSPDGEGGRKFVTKVVALSALFVGEFPRGFLEEFLVPFVLALEHERAVLQKDALDEATVFCLLHLDVDAKAGRSCCANVEPERLDLREKDIHLRILDGDCGDAVVAFEFEHAVQEADERLFVAQEHLECGVVERVEVGALLDFFVGLLDPDITGNLCVVGNKVFLFHRYSFAVLMLPVR